MFYLVMACDLNDLDSCNKLGIIYTKEKKWDKAFIAFNRLISSKVIPLMESSGSAMFSLAPILFLKSLNNFDVEKSGSFLAIL